MQTHTRKLIGLLIGLSSLSFLFNTAHAGSTLSAGYRHVCGIKTDGNLSCWGDNTHNQTQAPGGQFTQVGAGYWFNCGLKTDGAVVCWGEDANGQTSPPSGQFIQLDVGGNHACALYADGNPVCWGANGAGQASPPPGPFIQLALGADHSCGLTPNGTVSCWGSNSNEQSKEVADMTYITAGHKTTCGVKNDGTASCWGLVNGSYGYLSQIDFSVSGGNDSASSSYESFLFCGLKSDYSLSCPSSTAAPTGRFTYVTVGQAARQEVVGILVHAMTVRATPAASAKTAWSPVGAKTSMVAPPPPSTSTSNNPSRYRDRAIAPPLIPTSPYNYTVLPISR